MKGSFKGLSGVVDSHVSVVDEISALRSLVAVMSTAAFHGEREDLQGVGFLRILINDHLEKIAELVPELRSSRAP